MRKWFAAIAIAQCLSAVVVRAEKPTTNPIDGALNLTLTGDAITLTGAVDPKTGQHQQSPVVLNFHTNRVKATYLGVEASAADDTLRAQLKLPQGVGLAVRHVDVTRPAHSAGVQEHDVLYKLNDQLLINPEQLLVLIRTFKPDDKIELSVIREAQPVKLTATLVQKEVAAWQGRTDVTFEQAEGNVLRLLAPQKQDIATEPPPTTFKNQEPK
jgi:C-terminal processing protease CtpA/Prc